MSFFNWKGIAIVLGVIAVVIGLCVVDLSCGSKPTENSTVARIQRGITEGKSEFRKQEIERMSKLAFDMRVLAKRYVAQGEKRKAHRAIGVAQELDKKIKALKAEEAAAQ